MPNSPIARSARRAVLATMVTAGVLAAAVTATASASTGPPPSVTGGADIAYQTSAGSLAIVTPNGKTHPVGPHLAAHTSPSIAAGPGGTYYAVAQAGNGVLWAVNDKNKSQAQHARVVPGTSPSIGYYGPGRSYQTYFQSTPGKLGFLSGFGGKDLLAKDDYHLVAPQTSPTVSEGEAQIATNNGVNNPAFLVSYVNGTLGDPSMKGDIAPGSSPSAAYFPGPHGDNAHEVDAWEDNDPQFRLSYFLVNADRRGVATSRVINTSLGMMPGTSPAAAVQPDGSWEIAFQSTQGQLWILNSGGNAHNTGYGMDHLSSPAITALPGGGFEVAVNAGDNALWTVNGATFSGQSVPGAALSAGTSPSISAYLPTYHSTSAPPATPRHMTPPSPDSATQFTVQNCSHIALSPLEPRGRTLQVWVKDDSVPGSAFTLASVLNGLSLDGSCDALSAIIASWNLNPVSGHTYEIHVNGVTSNTVTCDTSPTACPLEWTTIIGLANFNSLTMSVNVT